MLLEGAPKVNVGLGFPNRGCVKVVAVDELNEKGELEDAPLDDPNNVGVPFMAEEAAVVLNTTGELLVDTLGAEDPKENTVDGELLAAALADEAPKENPVDSELLAAVEAEDVPKGNPVDGEALVAVLGAEDTPKENPVDGEELKPNTGDFGVCQLEPNTLGVLLLPELTELASAEEEEPRPGVVPELNGLAARFEPKGEPLDAKVVLPAEEKVGEDADEPN